MTSAGVTSPPDQLPATGRHVATAPSTPNRALAAWRRSVSARWQLVGYSVRTAPAQAAALATVALVAAGAPTIFVLSTGWLVTGIQTGAPVGGAIAVLIGSFLTIQLVTPVQEAMAMNLGRRVGEAVRVGVLNEVGRPTGIAHLLDPDFQAALTRARAAASAYFTPLSAVRSLAAVAPARINALLAAAILASYLWWAPLLLLAAWYVYRLTVRREVVTGVQRRAAPTGPQPLARADYVRGLLIKPQFAAELILAGARPWLMSRFTRDWSAGMAAIHGRRAGDLHAQLVAGAVLVAANAVVLAVVGATALRGDLTAAGVLVILQAMLALDGWGWVGPEYLVEYGAPHIEPVRQLPRALSAASDVDSGPLAVPSGPMAVAARNLRFSYRDVPVLDGVDLDVAAGRSVAVVGRNGAGKSTLARLLVGALEPDVGTVFVAGSPLGRYQRSRWMAGCAVLDQHSSKYPLTLAENVAGASAATHPDEVMAALHDAGAVAIVRSLPDGVGTLLAPADLGGTELSSGQWQRILLARVLFQARVGAHLIVLDEPTAHLDVRAEAEFNRSFTSLTRGISTVLISHRLSTVRHADEIVLLAGGRIIERGTHDELMTADTRYRRLFLLQADAATGGDS